MTRHRQYLIAGATLVLSSIGGDLTTELFSRMDSTEMESEEADACTFGLSLGVATFLL